MNRFSMLLEYGSVGMDPFLFYLFQLGSPVVYMVLLPMVYWLGNRRRGWILMLVFLLFMQGNAAIHSLADPPALYGISPGSDIDRLVGPFEPSQRSLKLPSAHAQAAMVIFGGIFVMAPSFGALVLCGPLIAGVGIAQLYLGVHSLLGVLGGWLLGGFALLFFYFLFRFDENDPAFLNGWGPRFFWVILGLGLALWNPSKSALLAGSALSAAALFEGLERRAVGMSDPKGFLARLARFALGIVPLIALFVPFAGILLAHPLWMKIPFLLAASFWIFICGPFMFKRIGI